MTIDKLDAIVQQFREVHHQKPEYICLAEDTYQKIVRQSGRQLRTDDVVYLRNVRLKEVCFQSPAEVICCAKRFDERYLVTPGGDIITSEMRPDSAAALLIRIAEIYAQYLFRAGDVVQSGISDEERDELYDEITVVESNFSDVRTLYELDEGAFIGTYGRYASADVEDVQILMDVLIHGRCAR